MRFFELFKLKKSFQVNSFELKKRYLDLQSTYHPDKQNLMSVGPLVVSEDQGQITDQSAFINKAYETLKDPLKRAKYLLEDSGLRVTDSTSDSFKTPQELLLRVMDIQEDIIDAHQNSKDLDKLAQENEERIRSSVALLSKHFEEGELKAAQLETVKLNYWKTIERLIHET